MKKILLLAFCVLVINAKAQSVFGSEDCPIMIEGEPQYSEWVTIDNKTATISKPEWVYDKERLVVSFTTPAVYCPCGCWWPNVYTQKRIDKKTGVIQERTKTVAYISKPTPKSEYQKAVDSFQTSKP